MVPSVDSKDSSTQTPKEAAICHQLFQIKGPLSASKVPLIWPATHIPSGMEWL